MLKVSDYIEKGIFERVVKAQNGTLVRVRFEIYECDGRLKGRVLHVEPIISITGGDAQMQAICGACATTTHEIVRSISFDSVISPYNELYFFISQPTRAPSFK